MSEHVPAQFNSLPAHFYEEQTATSEAATEGWTTEQPGTPHVLASTLRAAKKEPADDATVSVVAASTYAPPITP